MILIDREDVMEVGLSDHQAFLIAWEIGSPEAVANDYADILAEGPFLLAVNDEHVWAGQSPDTMYRVAERRLDPPNFRRWKYLADIYAASMGVSRQGLVLRFASMGRYVRSDRKRWLRWRQVYHWPEGGDLAWSSLTVGHHPTLEVREYMGERQVRYAG